jgi:hypothetical protein
MADLFDEIAEQKSGKRDVFDEVADQQSAPSFLGRIVNAFSYTGSHGPSVAPMPTPAQFEAEVEPHPGDDAATRSVKGVLRGAYGMAKFPVDVARAMVTPPADETEALTLKVAGPGGLALKRLGLDPAKKEYAAAKGVMDELGKTITTAQWQGPSPEFLPDVAKESAAVAGHLTAAAVPFAGPMVAGPVERMASGDVAGGIGEASVLAAPFVLHSLTKPSEGLRLKGSELPTPEAVPEGIAPGPGAQNLGTGIREAGGDLAQLGESIRRNRLPKAPDAFDHAELAKSLTPPLTLKGSIPRAIRGANEAVGKAFDSVMQTSQAIWDAYRRPPEWTDFDSARGAWDGAIQRSAFDGRQFAESIKAALPDKVRREAITNYVQAGGDEALLRQRAAASAPEYANGYETAANLTAEEN